MADSVIWPGWDVINCIGKGGFGAVYEIRREVFGDVERCALKVITIPKDSGEIEYMRCEGMDDDSITNTLHSQVGNIINEYKLMTRMRENPNIVHCDDFRYTRHENDLGWDIYIKMELLTPLMKVMDRMKDEKEIVRLGIELCNALAACQKHNIIHRDIKPQNIFLSPAGYYKLGDFGIARTMEHTTKATTGIGTYSFMAPEVAMGKSYGPTVDMYSLGLVLYWLLNERRGPFVPLPPAVPTFADNDIARTRRYTGEQIPEPLNGCDMLKRVVLKAIDFVPENRYQTAQKMMEALIEVKQFLTNKKAVPIKTEEQFGNLQNEKTVIDPLLQKHYTESANVQDKPNGNLQDLPFEEQSGETGINQEPFRSVESREYGKWPWVALGLTIAVIAVFLLLLFTQKNHHNEYNSPVENKSTGWVTIAGEKYYIDETGNAHTGWLEKNGEKYYFDTDGKMQTGWVWHFGKQYYYDESGRMVTGHQEIDGKMHYFNDEGQKTELGKIVAPQSVVSGGTITITRSDGKNVMGKFRSLAEPIKDCKSLSVLIEAIDQNLDNYENTVTFFVRDLAGQWIQVGEIDVVSWFTYEGSPASGNGSFYFYDAISFDAYACLSDASTYSQDYSVGARLSDIKTIPG